VVLKCNDEAQHSLRKGNQYYAEQLSKPFVHSQPHSTYQADPSHIANDFSSSKINLNFWFLESQAEIFQKTALSFS
jgi:hypothetical protein